MRRSLHSDVTVRMRCHQWKMLRSTQGKHPTRQLSFGKANCSLAARKQRRCFQLARGHSTISSQISNCRREGSEQGFSYRSPSCNASPAPTTQCLSQADARASTVQREARKSSSQKGINRTTHRLRYAASSPQDAHTVRSSGSSCVPRVAE